MEIYLVRHTKVKCSKNTCYGQSDVDLAITSEKDIQSVLDKLILEQKVPVYSSPLSRCKILANALSNSNYVCDERLMELNFGEWELKCWDALDRNSLENWANDFVNIKCPSGESFRNLYDRSNSFIKELIMEKYDTAILVTHAGVIRAILCEALGMPLKNAFNINLDYGSISKITINNLIVSIDYINK